MSYSTLIKRNKFHPKPFQILNFLPSPKRWGIHLSRISRWVFWGLKKKNRSPNHPGVCFPQQSGTKQPASKPRHCLHPFKSFSYSVKFSNPKSKTGPIPQWTWARSDISKTTDCSTRGDHQKIARIGFVFHQPSDITPNLRVVQVLLGVFSYVKQSTPPPLQANPFSNN